MLRALAGRTQSSGVSGVRALGCSEFSLRDTLGGLHASSGPVVQPMGARHVHAAPRSSYDDGVRSASVARFQSAAHVCEGRTDAASLRGACLPCRTLSAVGCPAAMAS